MVWMAGAVGLGALALAQAPASGGVAPPSTPGPWHQLGSAVTSRPGKTVRLFRGAVAPQALGIVVTSPSQRPIRVFWSSYCEVFDDDTMEAQQQARVTGVGTVTVYPPVLQSATRCYVFVTATVGTGAKVSAAEFSY
jgi:hypothetical protein